jgi:fructose-1,6-bisphosphatase/inositol monophosphatase family enzyme
MVSDADRDAEAAITGLLAAERPDDGLLGEEGSESEGSSGRRWVIDPLDGTTNFLYGLPAWAVSIALEDGDGVAAGVVLDPVRDELFAAVRGEGSWLAGERLAVSECGALDAALIATGFAYGAEQRRIQAESLPRILPRLRDIRRAGSAALDLCSVAASRVDGYYERGGQPWDWAAGTLIVTEAGGVTRDLPGVPLGLVATGPAIVDELEALVA